MKDIKILIIDDEKHIVDILKEFLSELLLKEKRYSLSYDSFMFFYNGFDALQSCTQTSYDIIFCDYQMALLNGVDFVGKLRQSAGPNQQTPVVIVTGHLSELPKNLKSIPLIMVIEKPFNPEDIEKALNHFQI